MQSAVESKNLVSIVLSEDWDLTVHVATLTLLIAAAVAVVLWLILRWWTSRRFPQFEIDSAELGFGNQKLSFKPNNLDRQIAYSIWIELSTRKIGLPINLDDDVVSEIYDSWYAFFGITRELVKSIPVTKVSNDSTGKIIKISIEVLNEGLRPHLTKWQARFRHWYENQLREKSDISPQDLQKNFPAYGTLRSDIMNVNERLIRYRSLMYELITGSRGDKNRPDRTR